MPIPVIAEPRVANAAGTAFSTLALLDGLQSDSGHYFGVQAVCYDPVRDRVYGLILSSAGSGQLATINEFSPFVTAKTWTSLAYTTPASNEVGHQGLAYEPISATDFRLWATAYGENTLDPHPAREAVRFKFTSGGAVSNVEYYTLFPTGYSNNTSCTPAIDPDGRFLIVHGTKLSGIEGDSYIRVFDLHALRDGGPGDYSSAYLAEYSTRGLVDNNNPLQGLATDGAVIAAISGSGVVENKRLFWFDLATGDLLYADSAFSIGKAKATTDGAGTRYEPEGLMFFPDGNDHILVCSILSGDTGARKTRLYIVDKPLERFWRGALVPADSSGGDEDGNVKSGTYSPTVVAGVNVASIGTIVTHWWTRIGNVVRVTGHVTLTATAASTLTRATLSLPVPRDAFTNTRGIVGAAQSNNASGFQSATLYSTTGDLTATLEFKSLAAGPVALWLDFSYLVA